MLNLIKYELIKKYKLFIITIISSLVLNLYLLTKGAAGSTLFIAIFPIVIAILYIVDIIKMYSDDLNKKSGYMLFMTPNSGYKIVVSKLMTAVLEVLAILVIYFIFILLNGAYIMYSSSVDMNFYEVIKFINDTLTGKLGINLFHVFLALFTLFVFLIAFITTVYTSMTIRKSLFSEVKFGALLSFLIFLVLNWVIMYLSSNIYSFMTPWYEPIIYSSPSTTVQAFYMSLPVNTFSIIQSIALTFCSGYLLENKINL
ncbi:hypothetical protein [Sedimentibacter sp.]|uniref:hypothetical protein n=1 Tax=Sedimentibacter sp. TaxID=1960295 RepID=UPI0028AA4A28|nr:hypothetical protein [Sedimentibacter sp.]